LTQRRKDTEKHWFVVRLRRTTIKTLRLRVSATNVFRTARFPQGVNQAHINTQ